MNFGESFAMLTGKIPKSKEYHEMTAKKQAHQVASQHDDPGGNIYSSLYQNAYNNSLANNTPNVAAQNNGSGDRPRSSFRNPQAGGLLSFFGGGSRLGDQPMTPQRFLENAMIPGLGIFRGLQRATGNQPYTMNTQSGTGPGMTAAQISAKYGVSPQVAAASMKAAPAPQYGAPMGFTPEPVETSLLSEYSGIPAGMEAQYSTSPAPLLAGQDMQLEVSSPPVDAEFEAWLQTDQGRPYNHPDVPADFVRRMFETSKRLKAGKF